MKHIIAFCFLFLLATSIINSQNLIKLDEVIEIPIALESFENVGVIPQVTLTVAPMDSPNDIFYNERFSNLPVSSGIVIFRVGSDEIVTGSFQDLVKQLELGNKVEICYVLNSEEEEIASGCFSPTTMPYAFSAKRSGISDVAESLKINENVSIDDFSLSNVTFPYIDNSNINAINGNDLFSLPNLYRINPQAEEQEVDFSKLKTSFANGYLGFPSFQYNEADESVLSSFFNLKNCLNFTESKDAGGNPIPVRQFTFGQTDNTPHVYGCAIPENIYATNTFYANNSGNFSAPFEFVYDGIQGSNALSTVNISSSAAYGYAAAGNAYGGFGTGTLGGFFGTPSPGAEVSTSFNASIGFELDQGFTSYMYYANAQDQENVYAGYFNGCVIFTKEPVITPDPKLQINSRSIESILDNIKELRPVKYNTREVNSTAKFGFIPEEMEKIFPELVTEVRVPSKTTMGKVPSIDEVKAVKSLSYIGMIPVLTKGLQELSIQLDEKEKEIEESKALIADLLRRIEQLEDKLK